MYYMRSHEFAPSAYPYAYSGMSGMGQIVPGIKVETQQAVIYGSLVLVGASVLIYFALRGKSTVGSVSKGPRK